jgi:hypothetical protein
MMSPSKPAKPIRRIIRLLRMHKRRGGGLAFLPAALEIVEPPPRSPIRCAIVATVILLFCAALLWAWSSTEDRPLMPSAGAVGELETQLDKLFAAWLCWPDAPTTEWTRNCVRVELRADQDCRPAAAMHPRFS